MNRRPAVGVGVIVIRGTKILLGKRLNSHGEGTWSFPGGHLEWSESIATCASREVFEETGLSIIPFMFGPYTYDIFTERDKQYVTVFVLAKSETGVPKVMEPNKCAVWKWFEWDELPEPLFSPVAQLKAQQFSPFKWNGILIKL